MSAIDHKAIGFDNEALHERAQLLATQFNLALSNDDLPRLNVTADKLVMLSEHFSPMWVDFCSDSVKKRREAGKKQGLVRACKPVPGLRILDITAGWGRDAVILASFGANVLMLERQPMMAALLADGLERLAQNPSISLSLELVHTEATNYLKKIIASHNTLRPAASPRDPIPDVIYIDPMHPQRQKSALVKKDMQVLQHLFGADEGVVELLQLALKCAKSRVVVKWPQRLAPLLKPNLSVEGKTVRFDIFLTGG